MSRFSQGALTLSDDSAIESILEDIPFFCVGIMTFGISTFLLVLRRGTLIGLCLYFSALLAFAASIFDLIQILARGSANVSAGRGTDGVRGLINTREVALSLALGLRYLFYWAFVSQPPRSQPRPVRRDNSYNPRYNSHSNDWQRWGYLGFLLKWSLLLLSAAIPVLQIIWRIAQREFGTLYSVESTLEIVVSSLYILKLFLNVYLSTERPWWRPLVSYAAPIGALTISLGVGVGQLVYFDFADTTLGHFLQAIELYTLIVFLLIMVFLPEPRPPRPMRSPPMLQVGRGEKAADNNISGPVMMQPEGFDDSPETAVIPHDNPEVEPTEVYRPSSISKRRDEPDLENGNYVGYDTGKSKGDTLEGFRGTIPSAPALAPPAPSERSAVVSFSSYYMQDRNSEMPMPSYNRPGNDSPVYGLNGIMGGAPKSRPDSGISVQGTANISRTSETSFDELLRQQGELDRSIAALRLFSPEPSTVSFIKPPETARSAVPSSKHPLSMATSSSSNLKADSASVFSLSIFPEPPATEQMPSPRVSMQAEPEPAKPRLVSNIPSDIRATREDSLFGETSALPTSIKQLLGHERFGSAGTQYDVTSFILNDSDFDSPLREHRPSDLFKEYAESSDAESGDESPVIATATSALARAASTLVVGTATPALAEVPSDAADNAQSDRTSSEARLRPFLLGNVTSSPAISSPLSGVPLSGPYISRNPPIGPRRPMPGRGLPTGTYRHLLKISGPRNDVERLEEPGDFERPRPSPLIVPSSPYKATRE